MDDGKLWAQERAGEPVSHCRAKLAHDAQQMIEQRNREAFASRRKLSPRWAA